MHNVDPLAPPQVPLFKGTQYVGNIFDLANTLVGLIYEHLPSTTLAVRSGQTIGDTFGLSEFSVAQKWNCNFTTINPHDATDSSLFWLTLFDFIQVQTGDTVRSKEIIVFVKSALDITVTSFETTLDETPDEDKAHVKKNFDVLFQFHLAVVKELLDRDDVSLDLTVQVGNFFYRFRTTFAAVLEFVVPELAFTHPLTKQGMEGWSVDVQAVVDVRLPASADDFMSWALTWQGAEIHLHLDEIVLDDRSGLALVNQSDDGEGGLRFPFGGITGDLILTDVVINISPRGELGGAVTLPVGPYHRYQEASLTWGGTACQPKNLVDFGLTVGSIALNLNNTAVGAILSQVPSLLDPIPAVEEAIEKGLEDLDDFGATGKAVADALIPFLPDVAVLETHDLYKPFTEAHLPFTYKGLYLEGAGRGIHILNDATGRKEPDWGVETPVPDRPDDKVPPVYDDLDPIPATGWTDLPRGVLVHAGGSDSDAGEPLPAGAGGYSPLGDLVLAVERRPRYLARLNGMTALPPVQEAAVRLWLDGVPPHAIAWVRTTDVAHKTGKVAGRPVSAETIASLDRLAASHPRQPDAFLFAAGARWPSINGTLTSLLAPLDTLAREAENVPPVGDASFYVPLRYELESTLARRKGSAVDPFWVGLSVNIVAVNNALQALVVSDTMGQSGTADYGPTGVPFRVDLEASRPTIRVDLSGFHDSRPLATIRGLTVHFDEERQPSTYTIACQVPMEAVKPGPGCIPDDAISDIVYNRSCLAEITGGGQITDVAYLNELLYRYFVHLRFASTEATLHGHTRIAGKPVGAIVEAGRQATHLPPLDTEINDDGLVTVQDLILSRTVRAILAAAFSAPIVFDPYYARSPVIRSYEAKDGWLNIYQTHS